MTTRIKTGAWSVVDDVFTLIGVTAVFSWLTLLPSLGLAWALGWIRSLDLAFLMVLARRGD